MNTARNSANPRWRLLRLLISSGLLLSMCTGFPGCGRRDEVTQSAPPSSSRSGPSPVDGRDPERPERSAQRTAAEAEAAAGSLPLYELRMKSRDVAGLDQTVYSNQTHPGTFLAGGQVYDRVRVRYRGAFARRWPKKPLKIFFTDEQPFEGRRRLNLNSAWRDPAYIRECLAYQIYTMCDAPASRSQMVRLHLNGEFRGLYVQVEQPDKAFAQRIGLKSASIYKAFSRSNQADERDLGSDAGYQRHYEKETQKETGYQELRVFCQGLARTTDPIDFFTRHVDLEKYVNYLAASALTQNWDAYNKNHFIVYDGHGSKKWFIVPWDLDRTLGDHWNWSFDRADLPVFLGTEEQPGVTGWNRMADRFFSEPRFRTLFLDRLQALLETEFTTDKLFPIVDRLESRISAEARLDRRRWPSQSSDFHRGIAEVKKFIERRRAFLLREVERLRS